MSGRLQQDSFIEAADLELLPRAIRRKISLNAKMSGPDQARMCLRA
jgi:hypothetical protein